MGKINNAISHYLSDNRRFADFFNGVCFHGETVVHSDDLSEASQVYHGIVSKGGKRDAERGERTRDVCRYLRSGGALRVLAVENQQMTDYTMPFRCMEYDVMEYGKQIDVLKKRNKQKGRTGNMMENMCGVGKDDCLAPVYTICLYHGVEAWDGPRTLGDMMDFGDEEDRFRKMFKDYPLHLYCVNDADDLHVFQTGIGMLFKVLQHRRDKKGLKELMENDERYRHIDADTLETMSVMLEQPSIWEERENYMEKNEKNEEEYDMCQALKEWAEEERSIGREEGADDKTRVMVKNMLLRGMPDDDIMAIAECDWAFVDKVRMEL